MKYKLENKDIVVVVLIIVAALVACGLSVYQYIEGVKKDKEVLHNNLKLENANLELKDKTKQLLKSQKKLIKIQGETIKNIVGDGFAEAYPQIKNDEIKLILRSKSDYNIYNILVEVINFDKMKTCDFEFKNNEYYFPEKCYTENVTKNNITTLNPNTWVELNYNLKPNFKSINLIVKQISNNITTLQYLIINYEEGQDKHPYFFRIFEISRANKEYKLLSQSKDNIPEEIWKERFPYKMNFNIIN